MKLDDYIHILKELKMDGLERILASPKQFRVNTINSLLLNIKMLNCGSNPVWMSQNRYINGHMIAEKVFVEFEGLGKTVSEQQDSHSDMLKLVEWAEKNGIRMVVLHSGNKSFHCYLHLVDQRGVADSFNRPYEELGKNLKALIGLKTIDMKCCEPKRLHRVPLTNRSGQKVCIPIPVNSLTSMSEIMNLTQNPKIRLGTYQTKGKEIPLSGLLTLTRNGGQSPTQETADFIPSHHSSFIPSTDVFGKYLNELLPQKCVLADLLTVHPEHETRVALMGWLNYLEYSIDEAISLVDKLADYAQWDDKVNGSDRRYYVEHAIRRKYKPYSCKKLCSKNLKCFGNQCPMFGK